MTKTIFVSYARADSARASAVASALSQQQLGVRFDRKDIALGESFVAFMNEALSEVDFCLLLWSVHTTGSPWVTAEWEAALHRAIGGRRGFLVTARLDNSALPPLLAPRLTVDLFPELEPGLSRLSALFRADERATRVTRRPVRSACAQQDRTPYDPEASEVFVTSAMFSMTLPVRVRLEAPCGLLLDDVIATGSLPQQYDVGKLTFRFEYTLAHGDTVLQRDRTLAEQGVTPSAILWLETAISQHSSIKPTRGRLSRAVMRGSNDPVIEAGWHCLRARLIDSGFADD